MKLLGNQKLGFSGVIKKIECNDEDLQYRLMVLGFIEGTVVTIIHEALFSDPIAIRLNNQCTIALRRKEASYIIVD